MQLEVAAPIPPDPGSGQPNPGHQQAGRRAAVLGHPISHSLSPVLHRAAYRVLGLDWTYERIDITEPELPEFLAGLDETWVGLSLTMPLKRAVLPLLDAVDPMAERISSVNTVLIADGERLGFNTDIAGIATTLSEAGVGQFPGDVAILGAGATASSALAALVDLRPSRVRICARRPEAADRSVGLAGELGLNAQAWPWQRCPELLGSDLVISTLPGDAAGPFADAAPPSPGILFDASYHPWPTRLAAAWTAAGGIVAPGYRMLLWQAAVQVELMTQQQPPVTEMWEALRAALGEGQ